MSSSSYTVQFKVIRSSSRKTVQFAVYTVQSKVPSPVQGTWSSPRYTVQVNKFFQVNKFYSLSFSCIGSLVVLVVQCNGPVQGTQSSSRYLVQFKVYGAVQVHGPIQGTQSSSRL